MVTSYWPDMVTVIACELSPLLHAYVAPGLAASKVIGCAMQAVISFRLLTGAGWKTTRTVSESVQYPFVTIAI